MKTSKSKPEHSNLLLEGLKLIALCPLCDSRQQPLSAKIIDQRENVFFVYMRCQKCSSSVIAVVAAGSTGLSSMCLVTDLTSADLQQIHFSEHLTADHVIDVHQSIHSNALIQALPMTKKTSKHAPRKSLKTR